MPISAQFKLNSGVLYSRIEEIKKNPPADVLAFKAAHPEYKTVNCTLLADYMGISESTLQNLKLGKATDSNCSTVWLLCTKLGVDPADLLNIPRKKACNPAECSSNAQARLDEKMLHIANLEMQFKDADGQLSGLRSIICEQNRQLGAAEGKVETLERLIAEKDGAVSRRNSGIKKRNIAIIAMAAIWFITIIFMLLHCVLH